jgi:hypothetical protein
MHPPVAHAPPGRFDADMARFLFRPLAFTLIAGIAIAQDQALMPKFDATAASRFATRSTASIASIPTRSRIRWQATPTCSRRDC